MQEGIFTKEKSLAIKGIAILMMLWHHCFLKDRYNGYPISFFPLFEYQVVNIAEFCKICVSLFAFVSGYGLYKTYDGNNKEKWIYRRLIKNLSGFWFVVICAWCITMLIDNRPIWIYGFEKSVFNGLINAGIDFLGLSNFFGKLPWEEFGSTQFSEDWWYMSASIIFILVLPLICFSIKKLGGIVTLALIFILPRIGNGYPGVIHFMSFMPAFCFGIIFAEYDLFERWNEQWKNGSNFQLKKLFCMLVMMFLVYKLYYHLPTKYFWDVKWGIIPIIVILFVNDYLTNIPILSKAFLILGKHSANMWWVHTFFRLYYCKDFIYGMRNVTLIFGSLVIFSLLTSLIIEKMKCKLGYDLWIKKLFKI